MSDDNKVTSLAEVTEQADTEHSRRCAEILESMSKETLRSIAIVGVSHKGIISTYHMGSSHRIFEIIGAVAMLQRRLMDERVERIDGD